MPPKLAVMSMNRLWAGEMTTARLVSEFEAVKPGLMPLPNDAKEVPYQEVLNWEYRLVFYDRDHMLFAPWPGA